MSENHSPPLHIALIMDGNGRWAKARNQSTIMGHRAGAENVRKITEHALQRGIQYLTFYTFSSENWLRKKEWIEELMGLLRWYLQHEIKSLARKDVRLKVIGQRSLLPQDIQQLITEAEAKTAENSKITVLLALSYGSRQEIADAMQQIAFKVKKGSLLPEHIDEEVVAQHLYTAGIPDPDLLIRTSGEQRLSNYLLWQLAYSEFIFLPTLWPDFTTADFDQALEIFYKRNRRYGL